MTRSRLPSPSSDEMPADGGCEATGEGLTRRSLLYAAAGAALTAQALADVDAAPATEDPIEAAFLFAFPVFEIARTRALANARAAAAGRPSMNLLGHRPGLTDHMNRAVTTPNNDTLYSAAWLDLSAGPVELIVPPAPGRYASAQLLDLFGDTVAVFGTVTMPEGVRLLIAGPGWQGDVPADRQLYRAPGPDLWLIVRVFVADEPDIAAASAVQRAFALQGAPQSPTPFAEQPDDGSDPERFLAVANEALGRSALPMVHAQRLPRLAAAGIRPGTATAWSTLAPEVQSQWRARLPALRASLRDGLQMVGAQINGWSYPNANIARFGADDRNRSRVALGGLGALPEDEAMYLSARTDSHGEALDGGKAYRLRIPGNVEVRAFWSLSMYEIDPLGRLYFTENPIGRYMLGNRSAGLQRDAAGNYQLLLQHLPPDDLANWLPAPRGPFALTFRAYLPGPAMRDGRFRLPAVQPL